MEENSNTIPQSCRESGTVFYITNLLPEIRGSMELFSAFNKALHILQNILTFIWSQQFEQLQPNSRLQ